MAFCTKKSILTTDIRDALNMANLPKVESILNPYLHQGNKCIAVGINFSIASKKIEQVLWEEVSNDK